MNLGLFQKFICYSESYLWFDFPIRLWKDILFFIYFLTGSNKEKSGSGSGLKVLKSGKDKKQKKKQLRKTLGKEVRKYW